MTAATAMLGLSTAAITAHHRHSGRRDNRRGERVVPRPRAQSSEGEGTKGPRSRQGTGRGRIEKTC